MKLSILCDVCNAFIATMAPVPGIAPDGTAKDDRIGDLRIVCDDCAKTYEVIVRGKGVQPPDGTTERAAFEKWYAPIFKGGEPANMPLRKNKTYVSMQDQIAWMAWQARANVAEPSMSTTSPPENSGTDELPIREVTDIDGEFLRYEEIPAQSIEGGAKP